MGLLDADTEEGQKLLGLLAAAGPTTDPNKTGFGARLLMANEGVQKWKADKQAAEYKAMLIEAQRRQFAQQEAEAQQRQMQAEQLARQQAALGKMVQMKGGGGGFAPASEGVFDGNMKFSPMKPPSLQVDQESVLEAIRLGADPKKVQEILALQNMGKQKVARTIKGIGPDGKEYEYQLDEFGNKQGEGFAQWKAPLLNDGGGQTNVLDPYNPLKSLGAIPKTQTFADKTSAGQLALAQQRFAFDKAGGAEANKPQLVDGQWVYKPSAENPQGKTVPVAGFQKQLGEGAKKTLSGVESLNGAIGEYLKELEGWGASDTLRPDRRAAMGTKYNNMMLQAKEAYNLGVLNGPDYDILQSVVKDPTTVSGAFVSNKALANQAKELSRMMSQYTAPSVRDSGAKAESTQAKGNKTVVKTGMYQGRKVVQYSDGTTDYAD